MSNRHKVLDPTRNEVLYFVPIEPRIIAITICIGFEPFQSRFTAGLKQAVCSRGIGMKIEK